MQRRLFIDNLSPTTTAEALKELFRSAGNVESISIPESQIGSVPSHAFIEMMTDGEAKKAIHLLNNTNWNGLRLTVTLAGPMNRRSGGFSGNRVFARRQLTK